MRPSNASLTQTPGEPTLRRCAPRQTPDGFAYPTRPGRHQQERPLRLPKMNGCGGQERPVSHPEFRPGDLPAQDRELVPQHEQFNVLHVQAATATDKRTQQSPNGEVEEGEGHTPILPTSRADSATPISVPFRVENNTMRTLLLRHFPDLEPALQGVAN